MKLFTVLSSPCLWFLLSMALAIAEPARTRTDLQRQLRATRRLQSVGQVIKLVLINAAADNIALDPLVNGAVVPPGSYSIEAITTGTVLSVRFGLNSNPSIQMENGAPWALCGNNGRDYTACNLPEGTHTVTATPFQLKNGGGLVGTSFQVTFSIGTSPPLPSPPIPTPMTVPVPIPTRAPTNAPTKAPTKTPTKAPAPAPVPTNPVPTPTNTPPTGSAGLLGLALIHVPTNKAVMDLVNGAVVDTALFPQANFNIQAIPIANTVKNVLFVETNRNEGTSPFARCGDSAAKFATCGDLIPQTSDFTVTAAPFDFSNKALPRLVVTFKIIGPTPVPPPVSPPVPTIVPPPTPIAPSPTTVGTGRWIEVNANAPIDVRHEACFVMVNNPTVGRRAYLVGGRNNGRVKDLDIYNPITRTWSKGLRPPIQLHHMQCVAAQGKLWIMAAWTDWFPDEKNAPNAYVYDPATNLWHNKTAMPLSRRRGSAAVVVSTDQSKIYVSHGNTGGHEQANFATSLGLLDVYDIASDSWTPLPSAPNPRDHTGGAMINGKVCVAGGRNGGEINWPPVAPTDCYDVATQQWQAMVPIPQVRAGSAYGTTCDGKLMVAGGEGNGKAWANVDVFDGTSWTTIDDLVIARHGSGLAVDCECNQIHIASGAKSAGGGAEIQSVETYFPGGVDVPCAA